MAMSNADRVSKALDLLSDGLRAACEQTWQGFYGEDWLARVRDQVHRAPREAGTHDVAFVLSGIKATWGDVFSHGYPPQVRSLVFEVADARNSWAHKQALNSDDTSRALDSMERLLEAFGNSDERQKIRTLRRDLMRQVFDEESRSERRRSAARPTEGKPLEGLTPWREIITPHADVASGRFSQAEFAADLYEVARGGAAEEYQDPEAFFARTYLTAGLSELLVGAARRLAGRGGDPVIELQTNFGGGKTHAMIALYHLASGVPAAQLPGVSEMLVEASLELPDAINRAVLVGQMISPAAPEQVEAEMSLHTLWGHLAYQLGGMDGYELVRADDEAGTNPGGSLRELLRRYGPAVVLIDEWVAYARQLLGVSSEGRRLAAGDFDTQFTFAQSLTEAAAASDNVVLLVTVPESVIETGGAHGQTALDRLKNVVGRNAAQWQPATTDESFEIVRRRLFDPIEPDKARVRDGVVRAFSEMYGKDTGAFPTGTAEADYRRRMELCYPIHPELFDRLFEDWSDLDKFQRTRGVLRLMATVISELWQRNDQSLLIMPGNVPMDASTVVGELKRYLEDNWDSVIKSDVDGPNALPLHIDIEYKHFGRVSATRRAARTAYLGSAPRPEGKQGVDVRSVVLGCAQPGEPTGQFADALRRLSDRATHLYLDGVQYWYSLVPNVTRTAKDRADSKYGDREADDEIRARITAQRGRGSFVAVHPFVAGPGDVPDSDDGVRLVVLTPEVTHSGGTQTSPAVELAERIVGQRDAGPRLHQNMLVFVAAAANRLAELRSAARYFLAWSSIVEDRLTLDLTAQQQRQAESKRAEASQQVDSMIAETFTHVLLPSRQPGTADIEWQTMRAAAAGDIGERISKRLGSEEQLIDRYSGGRVRMELDKHSLWSERGDVPVAALWEAYARYPYMSRLASREVLERAISDGVSQLNWQQETFAYAFAHDGDTWLGVRAGEHVELSASGLLVRPDCVLETPTRTPAADEAPPEAAAGQGHHSAEKLFDEPRTDAARDEHGADPTGFYARFRLDSVRGIGQLHDILEHVGTHLGPDLELELELRASDAAGYSESTRRTVSENAQSLMAQAAEFE
ncbi:DUF499 domain-containing protein [Candidatus Poriferisodalis sp.]|uniref:DUF499 domain-containing protein n=1 Tax=Candidatus Poriferisodalis sp. TaxID=3101277 RepID=UPI003B028BA9